MQKPDWLAVPSDPNELTPGLWPEAARRDTAGQLWLGGVPVASLVQDGTPVYVLDAAEFKRRAALVRSICSDFDVHYASKAFTCRRLVRWVREAGLGLDVCSPGELAIGLQAGMAPGAITLHGNNKTSDELVAALQAGVGRIVVDSTHEIDRLERACTQLGKTAQVLVRVTVGVNAHTHSYVQTGIEDQKFGFSIADGAAMAALRRLAGSPQLELVGVHSHIGSQIFTADAFRAAADRAVALLADFAVGEYELPELDLGGGLGIAYTSADEVLPLEDWAQTLRTAVADACARRGLSVPRLAIEPGRWLVGPAGVALYRVGTIKTVTLGQTQRTYVSVAGGMSDNPRPALYGADYTAVLANRASAAAPVLARVVGSHCESGDILVRDVYLPGDTAPGDLLAIPATGAYQRVLASNYNLTPRPGVVAVEEGVCTQLIQSETLEDLLRQDVSEGTNLTY